MEVERVEEVVGVGVRVTQFFWLHFQGEKQMKADEVKKVVHVIEYQN